jgi:hypothetical protein
MQRFHSENLALEFERQDLERPVAVPFRHAFGTP